MTARLQHLTVVVLMTAVLNIGCAEAVKAPQLKVTPKHVNDEVDFKVEKDQAVCSVRSPFGISQAILESLGVNWPDAVTLRLDLKGLEYLKVTNGKVILEAAVSSQDGSSRLWKDGNEDSPLDSEDPFWMEIRMVGDIGKPTTVPLNDGYFEILLPKALLKDNPKSITVNWIDFYR